MSENPNPETPNTETPATKPKDPDGYAVAFRTMQADISRLALALALGVAVDLGAELGQLLLPLGELAVAGLHLALEVVSKIRDALPHASDLELRGVLAALHEEGAIDRHGDKPDEVAAKALELIKSKAPALTRPPAQGGGPNGAPPQNTGRRFQSLI